VSELSDLIAKERAELDSAIDRGRREHDAIEARTCPWCSYTWSTTKGINARAPIWIEAAQRWGHLRCWQRHQDDLKVQHQREQNDEIYLRAVASWFRRTDKAIR